MSSPGWPDDAQLAAAWPALGPIASREPAGGGLLLRTRAGEVHLRRRALSRVAVEVFVTDELAARGVPVTALLPTADGQRCLTLGEAAYIAYPALPGLAREDFTAADAPARLHLVGQAAARLHLALAGIDVAEAVRHGLPRRPVTALTRRLPVQVVHRDLHTANVLLDGPRVSGYLDFDHLELGPAVVDLGYCGASPLARLLASEPDEQVAVARWLEVWEELVAGYRSVRELTDDEAGVLPALAVEVEEVDFLAWFLEVGDHENARVTRRVVELIRQNADELARRVGSPRRGP